MEDYFHQQFEQNSLLKIYNDNNRPLRTLDTIPLEVNSGKVSVSKIFIACRVIEALAVFDTDFSTVIQRQYYRNTNACN